MGLEKTEDIGSVEESSEVQELDELLDPDHADFEQIENWENPFKLFESSEARNEESMEHMNRGIKCALLGLGSAVAGFGSGAGAVMMNQPDVGVALMAGGTAGYAGGTGAYFIEHFRGLKDAYSGFGDHIEGQKWGYTGEDISGLLEESQIAVSLDTGTMSTEKSSENYKQVCSQIEEEQYDSIPLNGVRWEETEKGDFIYKIALAEISDFRSEEETPEPGDVNINTISEYVGVADEPTFSEFINPLAMKDPELLHDIEGYSPDDEKLSGGIKRGINHIYDKIRP